MDLKVIHIPLRKPLQFWYFVFIFARILINWNDWYRFWNWFTSAMKFFYEKNNHIWKLSHCCILCRNTIIKFTTVPMLFCHMKMHVYEYRCFKILFSFKAFKSFSVVFGQCTTLKTGFSSLKGSVKSAKNMRQSQPFLAIQLGVVLLLDLHVLSQANILQNSEMHGLTLYDLDNSLLYSKTVPLFGLVKHLIIVMRYECFISLTYVTVGWWSVCCNNTDSKEKGKVERYKSTFGRVQERGEGFVIWGKKNGHRYKRSTCGKTEKNGEGFVREPTPIETSVDEDEMLNRIYGSCL